MSAPHRHRWHTIGSTRSCATCGLGQTKVSKRWTDDPTITLGVCRWFALCTDPATSTTPHPVLGNVPTCDGCAAFIAACR
jgi:hypothetical protein